MCWTELDGRIAAVLDSGPCPVGVESTVLDLCGGQPVLLRPGGVTLEAIEALIGPVAHRASDLDALRSPGMLLSHYAPALPVRLNAHAIAPRRSLAGIRSAAARRVRRLQPQRDAAT